MDFALLFFYHIFVVSMMRWRSIKIDDTSGFLNEVDYRVTVVVCILSPGCYLFSGKIQKET